MSALPIGVAAPPALSAATFQQSPPPQEAPGLHTVASAEDLLSEWFSSHVVLTGSGRGALLLFMTHIGLGRYRDRVALSPMMSACVFDAVIRRAFPVDAAQAADLNSHSNADPQSGEYAAMTLLYHQYGIPQIRQPNLPGRVMEDICHAFFSARGAGGGRDWRGEAAIFSLPKFLPMSAMAGGLLVFDPALARELRARRDASPERPAAQRQRLAAEFRNGGNGSGGGAALEQVYLERLINPRIHADELGGLPATIAELAAIGEARRDVVQRLLAALPPAGWPDAGWPELMLRALPYALPVFAGEKALGRLQAELAGHGLEAGFYSIDQARRMSGPDHVRALLLPCHHLLAADVLQKLEQAILASKLPD